MSMFLEFKKIIAQGLYCSHIIKPLLKKYRGCDVVVLMYHRIVPRNPNLKTIQPGMYVTPMTFRSHLYLLKKYFIPISLSQYFETLNQSNEFKDGPFCILTFDDGWLDFYKYAFPLLTEFQIPATIFLPTDFIGTNKQFWTDRLAAILHKNDIRQTGKNGTKDKNSTIQALNTVSGPFEKRLERSIEILKQLRPEEIDEILNKIDGSADSEVCGPDRSFLSWEEVRKMSSSGIINIGSHTVTHRLLTTLKNEEIIIELVKSKEKLLSEKVVDPTFIPFCYPNGNHNSNIAALVEKAGYHLAVTTQNGWNDAASNRYMLKRVGLHQDISSSGSMFLSRIIGLW